MRLITPWFKLYVVDNIAWRSSFLNDVLNVLSRPLITCINKLIIIIAAVVVIIAAIIINYLLLLTTHRIWHYKLKHIIIIDII